MTKPIKALRDLIAVLSDDDLTDLRSYINAELDSRTQEAMGEQFLLTRDRPAPTG